VIGNDNSLGGGLIGATVSSSAPPPCSSGAGGSSAPTCGGSGWARATLRGALRHHGVVSRRDIRYAFLEEDGHVSVVTRRPAGE